MDYSPCLHRDNSHPIRARSLVLTASVSWPTYGFYNNGRNAISAGDSIQGNRAVKSKSDRVLCTVTRRLRWRPCKRALTSFNVVAQRF